LLFPLEVKLLKTAKREPRPMPDGEFDARQAVAPPWTAEAAELSRVFGLRRGEALWVERRHIDREEGGLFFSGEETKSGRDERVFGGDAGMALLERLRLQAVQRGQMHLVTWPGPKHWRAMLRGEDVPRTTWRPLKSVRRSWRTTIKTGEIDQPHRFHDVRARYVTEVAKVQAAATQDAARHADPATTALYIKLAAGEVRTAVTQAMARRPQRPNLKVAK
jgi:integrase